MKILDLNNVIAYLTAAQSRLEILHCLAPDELWEGALDMVLDDLMNAQLTLDLNDDDCADEES